MGKIKVAYYTWKQRNAPKARINIPVQIRPPEGDYFMILGPDEETIRKSVGTTGGTTPGAAPDASASRADILFLMRFFQKHKDILQPLVTASEREQFKDVNARLKQK